MNALGFHKPAGETRVVVAMSGGVDSSTTAALLAEQGFEVIGITLQLYHHGKAVGKKGTCCAGQDIFDARRVADLLAIPHYVLDYERRFREDVIEDFAESYLKGLTPIPCIRCNQTVKFRDLLGTARELGADALATGHYVRRRLGPGGLELHRAKDVSRDQSYFLFTTTPGQLDFLRFPLGDLSKSEVRALAERFALPVAAKPDSQDICFVPQGSYARIVEKLKPGAVEPGEIVDLEGRVLGRHEGIIRYTVGQRRGLGLAAPEPFYVVRLEPETQRVVVGPKRALLCRSFTASGLNWLDARPIPEQGIEAEVKLRSTHPGAEARISALGEGRIEVELAEPEEGVAPGQACVIYRGERVLGGAWIERADAALRAGPKAA